MTPQDGTRLYSGGKGQAPWLRTAEKVVAVLATDVVEYSRLIGADEQGTLAALKICRALFDELVKEFDAHEDRRTDADSAFARAALAPVARREVLCYIPSV